MSFYSTKSNLLRLFGYAGTVLLAAVLLRFAFAPLLPVFLALLTAKLINAPAGFLSRRLKLKKRTCAVICSVLLLLLVSAAVLFAVKGAIFTLSVLSEILPGRLSAFLTRLDRLEAGILDYIGAYPPELRSALSGAYDGVCQRLSQLPGRLSARLLRSVSAILSGTPGIILFAVTYSAGVFFFSAHYDEISAAASRRVPHAVRKKLSYVKAAAAGTVCRYLRSQLLLAAVAFVELSAAFVLIGVQTPFLASFLTALVDLLPFFGAGAVLIPWAVVSLLSGKAALGAELAVTYGIIYAVRSILEPKLVSAGSGIHPLFAFASAYAGFRIAGVAGMIAAPLLLMTSMLIIGKKQVTCGRSP